MNKKLIILISVVIIGIGIGLWQSDQPDSTPTPSGEVISITGEITCLPKVGNGPQTLECAMGLQAEDGSYYSLELPSTSSHQFPTNSTAVEVTGQLTDKEQYGPDGNRYDTVGTIVIDEISPYEQ